MATRIQQPEDTKRQGQGSRPFKSYAISRMVGKVEVALGTTERVEKDGKTVGWKASNGTLTSDVLLTHRDCVLWLLGSTAPAAAPAEKPVDDPKDSTQEPSATATEPESDLTAALRESVEAAKQVRATADDGTCSRVNGHGTPCQTKAGAGTDHKGEGACKSHEGHPIFVLTSAAA